MAIYLIVGQPRHGKSQFAAKMAHDYHEKNIEIQKRIDSGRFNPQTDIVREIYSDIEGHADKCDFVKPAPKDWRDVPPDSIIFMDEIHKRPEYCDNDGKMSQNPMIVDLTTHGHHNKDIILMTQDPERLNKGIRKLVEKMYLVKRPIQKPPFATIYEFERWLRDPWQAAASTRSVNYQDSYKFFYKKKWQDMYTSASAHTSIQFKIQSKFIYAIIAIVVLMSLSWVLFTKSGGDKLARNAIGGITGQKPTEENKTQNSNEQAVSSGLQNLEIECRKGVNVEKPECVAWFDSISKNGVSINPQQQASAQYITYDANNPYEVDLSNVPLQVVDYPRLTGCAKKPTGEVVGIDQQGNIMPNLNKSACQKWLNGERLFDYTKQQTQVTNNAPVPNQANNPQPSEPSIQELAKIEQAQLEGLI